MSLIYHVTQFCENAYNTYGDCGEYCSHPSGKCSGGCFQCCNEVHFPKEYSGQRRKDYNCQKFVYYYACRYSWKYCSEIVHALSTINDMSDMWSLSQYPYLNILSIGCGAAPDLMAFEYVAPKGKRIFYRGFDINPCWEPIQKVIENYVETSNNIQTHFSIKDIFRVLQNGKPSHRLYNVISLEYLISHFPEPERWSKAGLLFDGLINNQIRFRPSNTHIIIIINDIDHYASTYFDLLLQKLSERKIAYKYLKYHFGYRKSDYRDGSIQYKDATNCFQIPESMKQDFSCAISCNSAQLIVEIG